MRVLFDIVHPAHVHFYRHLRAQLEAEGHPTLVVARDKDVTEDLLRAYDIPYRLVRRARGTSRAAQASELLRRVAGLVRVGRRFRPDLILTRNPAGVQAARLLGSVGVFDTVDGRAAGVHFRAAAPLAHTITSPTSVLEHYGSKHRKYPGYKALAYLHPDVFTPDLGGTGLTAVDGPVFVVRLVANDAAHDRSSIGMSPGLQAAVVDRLADHGRVLVSCEGPITPALRRFRFDLPRHRLHDVLAHASLYVGDSGAMAEEAAVLGVPAHRLSSWAGPDHYLRELDERYGLVWRYAPEDSQLLLDRVERQLENLSETRSAHQTRRRKMLDDKVNVTNWYRSLLSELVG